MGKRKNKGELATVDDLLFHPGISNAWLCEQVFGNKLSPTTGVFSNKKNGKRGQKFTTEEMAKLEEIRKRLVGGT